MFVLFLAFGLLSFLSLFRGPLTIWGAGVATFAIVAGTGILPLAVLYPLFYIQSTTVTTQLLPHAKLEYVGHWLHQNQHPRLHEADAGICAAHCTDFGDCRLLYVCVNTVRPQLPEACRHTGMPEQERFTVKLK